MLEFLKLVVDRLRLWMLLFALGLSILLYKVSDFDGWWMLFAFCVSYLVLLGGESLIKSISKRRQRTREAENERAQQQAEDEFIKEQIWRRFNVLDEYNLVFVKAIYESKRDPYNPYVRYVQTGINGVYSDGYIDCRDEFKVILNDRRCCWLLRPEVIGGTTVITFHPYYLRLVSHYVETGKIERV